MTAPKNHYSAEFKAEVVQAILAEKETLAQISSRYGLHRNALTRWRAEALVATAPDSADVERLRKHIAALEAAHEKEKDLLYAEIGKLTTQLRWLEKKAARVGLRLDPTELGRSGSS